LTDDQARRAGNNQLRPQERGTQVIAGDRHSLKGSLAGVDLELVTLIVEDYGRAIEFFVAALGFDLVEDSSSVTNDGRPKRWVVVRAPGSSTGLLLAQADGEAQAAAVGHQFAGRVGFFLRVADFDIAFDRMRAAGVVFETAPRTEAYGRVAVFRDIAGNRWDLLGPSERGA
jgi:catechol 2,3-dioxygenase-like lactoylglutathione lyase family enzyme